MDLVGTLVRLARDLTIAKCVLLGAIPLTLYDYLLTLDDEIRYVWRGRKTWVSYLYIVNRILLIGRQFWAVYYLSDLSRSLAVCLARYYLHMVLIHFFLVSSDIFVALRVYAVARKSKILAVYFGTLLSARLIISLILSFVKHPMTADIFPYPIEAFDLCAIVINLRYTTVPNSIGIAFDLSAFLAILWYTYHDQRAHKVSRLIRTLVTDSTIYFLAMMAMQIFVQLSLYLMEGTSQQISFLAYGMLNPILSMRFGVSLRRSADPDRGQEWDLTHFTTVSFAGGPSLDTQASTVHENIEMDPLDQPFDKLQTHGS